MKQQDAQLGTFVFIGIFIALSNQVIQFLQIFGFNAPTANIVIVGIIALLVWYNMRIAKVLAAI